MIERWQIGSREIKVPERHTSEPKELSFKAQYDGRSWWIWLDGWTYRLRRLPSEHSSAALSSEEESSVRAPMTGTITAILTSSGKKVEGGDVLLKMEAMKMEYSLIAPCSGTVQKMTCSTGDVVEADQTLIEIRPTRK